MATSKYITISESENHIDSTGLKYPDIFSFPIINFEFNDIPQKYILTQQDVYRFDLLMYSYYGNANYDDLVLFINNIEHISLIDPGFTIYLPSKRDLDLFYQENYK